jgi:hypothetical protein
MMREFDHVGIVTDEKQPSEMWVEATRVWVTDPSKHPYKIEYLRYEPDSPVTNEVRTLPHIAFRVPALEPEMEGLPVLLGPFNANENVRVVFVLRDGAVYEFMESSKGANWHEASN